ncbi:acyl-coenzyme A thioesterase PaaI-like protein [Bradyrhizobium sp. GM24.11]
MAAFEPKNTGYRAAAIAMFERQPAMRTLGIVIVRLAPAEAELAMLHSPELTQQNGFVHAGIITAGLDNACGVAAFTLMPPEADILTVEFKTTLLAPARRRAFCVQGRRCQAWSYADLLRGEGVCRARGQDHADRDDDRHADGNAAPCCGFARTARVPRLAAC